MKSFISISSIALVLALSKGAYSLAIDGTSSDVAHTDSSFGSAAPTTYADSSYGGVSPTTYADSSDGGAAPTYTQSSSIILCPEGYYTRPLVSSTTPPQAEGTHSIIARAPQAIDGTSSDIAGAPHADGTSTVIATSSHAGGHSTVTASSHAGDHSTVTASSLADGHSTFVTASSHAGGTASDGSASPQPTNGIPPQCIPIDSPSTSTDTTNGDTGSPLNLNQKAPEGAAVSTRSAGSAGLILLAGVVSAFML